VNVSRLARANFAPNCGQLARPIAVPATQDYRRASFMGIHVFASASRHGQCGIASVCRTDLFNDSRVRENIAPNILARLLSAVREETSVFAGRSAPVGVSQLCTTPLDTRIRIIKKHLQAFELYLFFNLYVTAPSINSRNTV